MIPARSVGDIIALAMHTYSPGNAQEKVHARNSETQDKVQAQHVLCSIALTVCHDLTSMWPPSCHAAGSHSNAPYRLKAAEIAATAVSGSARHVSGDGR